MNNIICKKFRDIDLQDTFFQSLRNDYHGFDNWYKGKSDKDAYVQYDDLGWLTGFLYLKIEENIVEDVFPNIIADKILKIGTFKIDAHGTKMGEQFLKIIFDYAIDNEADICYMTIFKKHVSLINLIQQFGFEYYGTKGDGINKENVYIKKMGVITGDISKDFPFIELSNVKKYILSIYPQYHSIMFPDSILKTEDKGIIRDVSYTNSIHKIYVCNMSLVETLNYGDVIVVYRTADKDKSAEYSSVATSICVVSEVRKQDDFVSFNDFYNYAISYSVFDRNDLMYWYNKGECKAVKMTYNAALNKRIIRRDLIEDIGLERNQYWGIFELTDEQFKEIVKIGNVNNKLFL